MSNSVFYLIQFLNGLSLGMNLFIVAAGLTLILGVLRILNFAHGVFYMLGGYIAYSVAAALDFKGGFWIATLAAGAALAVLALVIERTLLRRLYDRDQTHQLLFTFALVLLIGDFVKVIWGTDFLSISFPPGLDGATNLGIVYYPSYRLFLCVVGFLVALVLWYAINRTKWGRIIRAATQDREMLTALGVNVGLVYAAVFMIGSALAGIGGALAAPSIALYPAMHAEIIVESFIIVIIGGLGNLWGALLGAIILGQLTVFGTFLVPEFELVLIYLMMVLVLMFRPWGLLGRPEAGSSR